MIKNLVHIDKKVLTPEDKTITSEVSQVPAKTIIGRPKIYDLKSGKLLADEENLVVLTGREFLAQKLSSLTPNSVYDLRQHEIRYFGIGSGGASGLVASDPQDTDVDLASPIKFSETGISTSSNNYRYISNGYLKRIQTVGDDISGSIQIVEETHEVNTSTGLITVDKFTTIKFTLIIEETEPVNKPFTFNEAGLYAVKYDDNGNPTDDTILVARFTTIDKNLGYSDGLKIEWSILV